MKDEKRRDEVRYHVADMLSLETTIEEALDRQLKDVEKHPTAGAAVLRFHTMVRSHREAMRTHLKEIGGSEPGPVKSAVAGLFGMAAGAFDRLRPEAASRDLRDEYTAFNLAAMGYGMLHATAHMLGVASTADLAERHMRDYAQAIQEINQIIADVVAWELRKDQYTIDQPLVSHATETINRIWRETSPSYTMRAAA